MGGAYVGPTQNRVFNLAKELDLTFYNVNDKERSVLDLRVSTSHVSVVAIIDTVQVCIQSVLLQPLEAALERTSYKLSEAKYYLRKHEQYLLDQSLLNDT